MMHTPISFYRPEDNVSVREYVTKCVLSGNTCLRLAALDLGLCEMRTIEAENLGCVLGTERGKGSLFVSNSYPDQRGGRGKWEGGRLRTVTGGGGRVGQLWGT